VTKCRVRSFVEGVVQAFGWVIRSLYKLSRTFFVDVVAQCTPPSGLRSVHPQWLLRSRVLPVLVLPVLVLPVLVLPVLLLAGL